MIKPKITISSGYHSFKTTTFIKKLYRVVDRHYKDENFNITQLVELMYLSERQIQRKVKTLFGLSPSNFICYYRVYKSIPLLNNGKQITVVSYEVGFNSSNYFSRCFKKVMNQSPTSYINQSN